MQAISDFIHEAKQTLDLPYEEISTRSTIGLVARNDRMQISWEKDLVSGSVQLNISEAESSYVGTGTTCREAFVNKVEL